MRPLGLERLRKGCSDGGVAGIVSTRERREHDLIALDPGQYARVPSKQTRRAGQDCVEHWLDIRLRAADDAQDVAGGSLLVERGGEIAIARLELGEEADVFDRDNGLVSKRLEK